MEFRDIEIFLTLAEELHFGRTAERLHITPSRVSHAIKKQERRIGGALFERTSRSVRLTPLGERLRDDLVPAYAQIQQAIDRAAAEAGGITGTVRAGYTTPWCADLVIEASRRFRARHPGCTVQAQEVHFHDLLGPLRRGDLDLQVTELPVTGPGIATGPVVFSEPRALLVSADHPVAQRESVSLEDLADVPLLIPAAGFPQSLLDSHLPARTPAGRPIPRGATYSYWSEVPALAAAGLGGCPVATRAAQYHHRPGIAFVPFRDAPPMDYGVVWPATGRTPQTLKFADVIREVANAQPAER
ncbi:LysR family transcriptional regulator [Actinomadura nitritigenes]|uniref:LysR family transcriptional regulator n=1 Tax=Actinomadura nitritigenes TaxID=134602 RepID=UPI003D8E27AB